MISKQLEKVANILILLFPAALVTIEDAGAVVILSFLAVSIIGLVLNRSRLPLANNEKILFGAIGAYLALSGFNIWLFEADISEMDNVTLFVLLLPAFFYIRKSNINSNHILTGLLAGAIATLGIALFQIFYLDLDRAYGTLKAVPFGGISITLAVMCLTVALFTDGTRFKRWMLFGFVAALGASVLSGTRGAWLCLFTVLAVFMIINPNKWSIKLRLIASLATIVLINSAYFIPGVGLRIDQAVQNLNTYYLDDKVNTSLGRRLETWRASWIGIMEHPITGAGAGNYHSWIQELAERGRINPHIKPIAHIHNDYLSAAFHRGWPGLITLLVLYMAPLLLFWQRFKLASGDQ
ncbi:MAG: O-antigen ligase family protein, partial [Gammaproteobacteria bacterium]|nr:O-antigen ligase family protein [Gammaproteobacteria bacterium]